MGGGRGGRPAGMGALPGGLGALPGAFPGAAAERAAEISGPVAAAVPGDAVRGTLAAAAAFSLGNVVFSAALRRLPGLGLSQGLLPIQGSSRLVAMVHAVLTVLLSAGVVAHLSPQEVHDRVPLPLSETERRMLYLTCGYFLQDTAVLVLFERDAMFFVHHVSGLAIFATLLRYDCAGVAACIALFWGEMTNPLLSLWWLARKAKNEALSDVVSPIFTVVFPVIRLIVIPVYIFALIWGFLVTGEVRMPFAGRTLVSALMALVTFGGFVWARSTFLGYFKHRKKRRAKLLAAQAQAKTKTG